MWCEDRETDKGWWLGFWELHLKPHNTAFLSPPSLLSDAGAGQELRGGVYQATLNRLSAALGVTLRHARRGQLLQPDCTGNVVVSYCSRALLSCVGAFAASCCTAQWCVRGIGPWHAVRSPAVWQQHRYSCTAPDRYPVAQVYLLCMCPVQPCAGTMGQFTTCAC